MNSVQSSIEMARPDQVGSAVSKKEMLFVVGATLAALALRVFMLRFSGLIPSDGVWYAILGKNLASGDFERGMSTYWAPLYPLLIGVTSLFIDDLELAGRLVSVVSGGLLVIPVYMFARRLYSKTEARVAAVLIVICPQLLSFSILGLTESLYTLLFTLAVMVAVSALTQGKMWLFFLAGAGFGACYLTKPEAIGFVVLLVVVTVAGRLFNRTADLRSLLASALLVFIGFAILSLPYLVYLRSETGKWTVSEKLIGAFGMGHARDRWRYLIDDGQTTMADKLWAVGASRALSAVGVGPVPTEVVAEPVPTESTPESASTELVAKPVPTEAAAEPVPTETAAEAVSTETAGEAGSPEAESGTRFWFPGPADVFRKLYVEYLTVVAMMTPALFFLAGIGLVGPGWSGVRARTEVYLSLFLIATLVGYAAVGFVSTRYLGVVLPILICWSARGVVVLERCLSNIEKEVRLSAGFLSRHSTAVRLVLVICLVASLVPSLSRVAAADKGNEEQIAMWIKRDSDPKKPLIMATSPLMAFFSGGAHLYIPADEYGVVIDYARRKEVDYVVVEERRINLTLRFKFLLEGTHNHPGLELVHRDDTPGHKVRVFKLTKPQGVVAPGADAL